MNRAGESTMQSARPACQRAEPLGLEQTSVPRRLYGRVLGRLLQLGRLKRRYALSCENGGRRGRSMLTHSRRQDGLRRRSSRLGRAEPLNRTDLWRMLQRSLWTRRQGFPFLSNAAYGSI